MRVLRIETIDSIHIRVVQRAENFFCLEVLRKVSCNKENGSNVFREEWRSLNNFEAQDAALLAMSHMTVIAGLLATFGGKPSAIFSSMQKHANSGKGVVVVSVGSLEKTNEAKTTMGKFSKIARAILQGKEVRNG